MPRPTSRNIAQEVREGIESYAKLIAGKPTKGKITIVRIPAEVDVKEIRRSLKLSQDEFARRYALPLATIRKWEQGVRRPDSASRAYLTLIHRDPKTVSRVLAAG